jgi:hypothetical protein
MAYIAMAAREPMRLTALSPIMAQVHLLNQKSLNFLLPAYAVQDVGTPTVQLRAQLFVCSRGLRRRMRLPLSTVRLKGTTWTWY